MFGNHPLISKLENQFKQSLPGSKAQFLMAPDPKEYYNRISTNFKPAAVLALLYPIKDRIHIVYIQRSISVPADKHSGQISFPGGKLEESDTNLLACALRETNEEIGIAPENITVLGQLSQVFVYVSNFMVYPFVAFTNERPQFTLDPLEVAHVIETPLDLLLDTKNSKKKDLQIRNFTLTDVPYYDIDGKVLWGATAMMTSELLYIINN